MNRVAPATYSSDMLKSMKADRFRRKIQAIKTTILHEVEAEAQIELDELFQTHKSNLDVSSGYQIANIYYELRDYNSCLKVVDAIKADENRKQPKLQNLKGLCFMRLGNLKYAIDLFEICIVIDPKYKVALNNLGNIYMQSKDYDKAKSYFHRSKQGILGSNQASNRWNNKAVACFNIALANLFSEDFTSFLHELAELEVYLSPEMNVFKNLMLSGINLMVMKPNFISNALILEEVFHLIFHADQPSRLSDENTKSSLGHK